MYLTQQKQNSEKQKQQNRLQKNNNKPETQSTDYFEEDGCSTAALEQQKQKPATAQATGVDNVSIQSNPLILTVTAQVFRLTNKNNNAGQQQ